MIVEVIEETGWSGPRTENPYRILIDGKIYITPKGFSAFWTEAAALRCIMKEIGVAPIDGVRQIHKSIMRQDYV